MEKEIDKGKNEKMARGCFFMQTDISVLLMKMNGAGGLRKTGDSHQLNDVDESLNSIF